MKKLGLVLPLLLLFPLAACGAPKYQVDYCGRKGSYKGAKDAYPAGAQVVLYFPYIATDTDYDFLLDGERINYSYDDDKGFVIAFTMPDHDVKLACDSRNSMVWQPPDEMPGDDTP